MRENQKNKGEDTKNIKKEIMLDVWAADMFSITSQTQTACLVETHTCGHGQTGEGKHVFIGFSFYLDDPAITNIIVVLVIKNLVER